MIDKNIMLAVVSIARCDLCLNTEQHDKLCLQHETELQAALIAWHAALARENKVLLKKVNEHRKTLGIEPLETIEV
jgi:hypothetical protein